jgi:hypothetical protein
MAMGTKQIVFAAVAVLVAASSQAATVRLDKFSSSSEKVNIVGEGARLAGEFVGEIDGKAFSTFRTDLKNGFKLGNTYEDYQLKSVDETSTLWGDKQYSDLSKLFTSHYKDVANTKSGAVAFQLAIWEILYEEKDRYDVTKGSLDVRNASKSARRLANEWLASLASLDDVAGYEIRSVYSNDPKNQWAFLMATPVSEPSVYARALVSLGIAAGFARRRRTKS